MCLAKLAPSLKLITVDVCWFEVVHITFFGKHNKVAAAVVCKKKKTSFGPTLGYATNWADNAFGLTLC